MTAEDKRRRMVEGFAAGKPIAEIAKDAGMAIGSVDNWRRDESGKSSTSMELLPPTEQKRVKVADALASDPTKTDRQIAKETGVSHPTVSKVRKELDASLPPGFNPGDLEALNPTQPQPVAEPEPLIDRTTQPNFDGPSPTW